MEFYFHTRKTPHTCHINPPKHENGEVFNISLPTHNKQCISIREINCRLLWCKITDDFENYMKQIRICGRNGHLLTGETRDTSGVHKFSKKPTNHLKTLGARMVTRKGPKNIRSHRTKFSRNGDLAPGICAMLWYLHTCTCTYQWPHVRAYLCIGTVWRYLRFGSNLWTECTHIRDWSWTTFQFLTYARTTFMCSFLPSPLRRK